NTPVYIKRIDYDNLEGVIAHELGHKIAWRDTQLVYEWLLLFPLRREGMRFSLSDASFEKQITNQGAFDAYSAFNAIIDRPEKPVPIRDQISQLTIGKGYLQQSVSNSRLRVTKYTPHGAEDITGTFKTLAATVSGFPKALVAQLSEIVLLPNLSGDGLVTFPRLDEMGHSETFIKAFYTVCEDISQSIYYAFGATYHPDEFKGAIAQINLNPLSRKRIDVLNDYGLIRKDMYAKLIGQPYQRSIKEAAMQAMGVPYWSTT
ncbi:MAG: hypothetical protein HGA85_06340, partial [Nanoarchaeota archaeon]|nr:hypothetical protein [Nanoarchaeota archaeon]